MTGFASKTPPVKVVVDKQYFNMLIQVLTKIEKIEVTRRGDVRRAKLYYLRDRIGKAAKTKEKKD